MRSMRLSSFLRASSAAGVRPSRASTSQWRSDDRHQHVVVVDGEVVDAGLGDGEGVGLEVDDAGAGHLELADLALHGHDHARRVELEGGGAEVAVEEVVAVLVGGHALHDLVAGLVVEQLAGVVVGDAGGQLLERDVDDAVGDAVELGHLAASRPAACGPARAPPGRACG